MCSNLPEWLSYIEKHYQYNHGGTADGLQRFHNVAKNLQLDTFPCTVITVGGTNGKGSCVIYLENILRAAGYKVGAYMSPHILYFNERIRINGRDVSDIQLIEAFSQIDSLIRGSQITYFEFTTLAALYIFKHNPVDVVVLEIGLGGRLDAVNIVDSDLSIITTIAFDHMEQLGHTLEQIGREKAGIMRPYKPCVCGDRRPPNSIMEHAKNIGASLYRLHQDFDYYKQANFWELELPAQKLVNLPLPKLPLQDAAIAITALSLLPISIDIKAIKAGLINANLLGRWQTIRQNPLVIVDVAHNPESTAFLAEQLANHPIEGKTLAVVGILKDKDIENTLKPMIPRVDQWLVGSLDQDTMRGAKASDLMKYLDIFEAKLCYNYECMFMAYKGALAKCTAKDRIIVFGSFYSVANILREENKSGNQN
jgi:dihydrofolate synthase / folylpolyglutamate synthase